MPLRRAMISAALLAVSPGAAHAGECAPFYFVNIQDVRAAERTGFLAAMRNNALNSRKEAANTAFEVLEPVAGGPTLVLFEGWRSREGYLQHEGSAHVAPVLARVQAAFASPERKYTLCPLLDVTAGGDRDRATDTAAPTIVTILTVDPASLDTAAARIADHARAARALPDNRAFDLYRDSTRPGTLVIYQRWATSAALKAYRAQPSTRHLAQQLERLRIAPAEELTLKDIVPRGM